MSSCNNRNPKPPCQEGYEEKVNKKGDICCFKQKSKPEKPLCNNRNPEPPCKEGYEEKLTTNKDGKSGNCCYKVNQQKLEAEKAQAEKKQKKALAEDLAAARFAIGQALKSEAIRKEQKRKEALELLKQKKVNEEMLKKQKLEKQKLLKEQEELDAKREIEQMKNQNMFNEQKKQDELQKKLMGLTSEKCNKRNPSPPCAEGYSENVRTLKNGSQYKCCFKIKKTLKKKSSCNKRNPPPPCKEGYEIQTKVGKDGVKTSCCYKSKTLKKSDCGVRNPKPPCSEGSEAITKTRKNGTKITCCYRTKKQPKLKEPKVRRSLFVDHDSLFEFDQLSEVREPDRQLPRRLATSPEGLLVSEKYDGHRMLYDPALNEGLSRTGKTSFNLPDNWKSALSVSDMPLDGEAFLVGLPATQVAALRTDSKLSKELWKNVVQYNVFDLPTHPGEFTERIQAYTKIVEKVCKKWDTENPGKKCPIVAVPHKLAKTPDEIKAIFKEVMSKKFVCPIDLAEYDIETRPQPAEGVVLSVPNKKYEFGKSFAKYKYKHRMDFDCVVIEPHPLKQSIKCYREDCSAPPDENSSVFYMSTEGVPKEMFLPGDVLKYTCLGFGKGSDKCPAVPKMPKFHSWRSEEIAKQKKKIKLQPAPKDGPNEELAQYFDKVAKGYYDKKLNLKAIAYKKYAAITRRTMEKITLKNYDQVYGKTTSFGRQAKCILEGSSFETCVGDRLT